MDNNQNRSIITDANSHNKIEQSSLEQVDKIFMLEQSLIQKENIIKSYNKKNKYSSPFVVIDPNKAITAFHQ